MVATVFLDLFDEASNTNLDSHSPDTGTGWTLAEQTGATVLRVGGGDGWVEASADESSDRLLYTADDQPTGVEYDVRSEINITGGFGTDHAAFLLGRYADTSNYYTAGKYTNSASPDKILAKKVAGVHTELGNANVGEADKMKFEIKDATKKVFTGSDWASLTENISSTDNALASKGKGGLGLGNVWVSTDDIENTYNFLDFYIEEEAAANPKGPFGMPLHGPFGGPIGA